MLCYVMLCYFSFIYLLILLLIFFFFVIVPFLAGATRGNNECYAHGTTAHQQ